MNSNIKDEIEIDLLDLLKSLFKHIWVIIGATLVCGIIALSYTHYLITPMYTSSTLLYVNNSSISLGNTKVNISSSDISAAQSLVDTYIVILNSRNTLEDVIEESGVDYSYKELVDMIDSKSVNGTEIFTVNVTGPDPSETKLIANTIARVLPKKIASIVDGSSVQVVDYAVKPTHKTSPSLAKNTAVGMMFGFILSCGIIALRSFFDKLIKDDEYLIQTYDLPVLAIIPDLEASGKKNEAGYYYAQSHRNKGGQDESKKK